MIYNPKDEEVSVTLVPGDTNLEKRVRTLHALGPHTLATKAVLRKSLGIPALSELLSAQRSQKIVVVGADDALLHQLACMPVDVAGVLDSGRRAFYDMERFTGWHATHLGLTLNRVVDVYNDLTRTPYAVGGNDHQRMGKRERNKVHVPQRQEQVVNSNKSKKRKKRK